MRRIIFVDDEPKVLEGLQRLLRGHRSRWDMTFVDGGEDALAALAETPFDVIVSDMRMPRMDGMVLLTRVQEQFPGVVRIVLTGHTELEAALRAVPVAHLFLTKPCDAETLEETIDRACDLQAVLEDETLKRGLAAMSSVPSLPHVYADVTRALVDPEVSLAVVARLIEQDVGMCAKVLRLVNAGFFGLPRNVSNIETAIRLLGTSMLKNLVLSAEVFGKVGLVPGLPGFSIATLQRHSLLAAGIARQLLPDKHQAEDAFMAAMLHDIGMLVLATRATEDLSRVLAASLETGRALHEIERERGVVTHAQVGAYVLGLWNLPYPIVEAVAHHHQPAHVSQRTFGVLGAVHVANALAHEQATGTAGSAPGSEAGLDLAYLEAVGVSDRLAEWRAMAAEQSGAVAA
jgi:HD-like signal output (HDOD) protein